MLDDNYVKYCEQFNDIFGMYNISDHLFDDENDNATSDINALREFSKYIVEEHTTILDQDDNWNVLLYKEALYITRLDTSLNRGLKASRELTLFR